MLDFNKILLDGGVLSALLMLIFLGIGLTSPRLFLSKKNVPADILAAVPPRTEEEKRKAIWVGLPLLALMLILPGWSAYTFAQQSGAAFGAVFAHTYLVLFVPFLADLLILDWLILNTITPKWVVYPGTEGFAGYKDYRFHLRAHVRGLFVLLFLAALIAGAVVWVS
ncbi:MAG: hypothetical protein HYZ26_04225 [Chloroflexi bacterium]|nr:hypothetical protein [Chloroflexota bacterium]